MHVPFVDLQAQYQSLKPDIVKSVHAILDRSDYVGGKDIQLFEEEFARYLGVKNVVALSSGTDALHLGLLALGVQHGDEVITTPHTFLATAEAISAVGARPVFVDIDPSTYTLDPTLLEAAITPRTKAIIPVHLYGQVADMDPIMDIASRYGLKVFEDAAQAHAARYEGRMAGSIGHAAAFSFYPGKNLGAYGDAGAVATDDDYTADRIRLLANHGQKSKYEHVAIGFCDRMDTLQAAVLRVKLPHLEQWTESRRQVATWYSDLLTDAPSVLRPMEPAYSRSVYHLYVIRVPDRAGVQSALMEAGISTQIHYPLPVHLQPPYQFLGYRQGDFPHSERAASEVLSLPMYAELTREQVEYVADEVRDVVSSRTRSSLPV